MGTDIVYIPRIQEALNRFGERFLQRVYTPIEQRDCGQIRSHGHDDPDSMTQVFIKQLAGRWAAKEAVVKALGTGWRGVSYTDIEIQRHVSGAPQVYLYRRAASLAATWENCQWQLSLSHDKDYAIATVLMVYASSSP